MAHKVVHGALVHGKLAHESGLELAGFELDDYEATKSKMVKEQVDIEVIAANLQVDLPSHEGEVLSELEQELLDVIS